MKAKLTFWAFGFENTLVAAPKIGFPEGCPLKSPPDGAFANNDGPVDVFYAPPFENNEGPVFILAPPNSPPFTGAAPDDVEPKNPVGGAANEKPPEAGGFGLLKILPVFYTVDGGGAPKILLGFSGVGSFY